MVSQPARTALICMLALLATLGLSHLLGLNRWVVSYAEKWWAIPLYPLLFPFLLFLSLFFLALWARRRSAPALPFILLGVLGGHLAGLASYLGAVMLLPGALERLENSVRLMGGWGFVTFMCIAPVPCWDGCTEA